MSQRVGCAILAAGASRRLGQPKQLVMVHGEPLVAHAAWAGAGSECTATAVVVGAHATRVTQAVQNIPVQVILNQAWREGIAASIRCAAAWATRLRLGALVLAPCDLPRLDSRHINKLLQWFRASNRLVASHYSGARGVPVLFPASYFSRLSELTGDRGASPLVRSATDVVEVEWPDGTYDVDWPSQLDASE